MEYHMSRPLLAVQPFSGPTLGRRRRKDLDLPPHMVRRGKSYYYVCNGKPRRWIPLGNDLSIALREWARLESGKPPEMQVGELCDHYIAIRRADKAKPLSDNTFRQY